jgi:hypothetical protein
MTEISTHLALVGVIALGLGLVHVVLPRTLRWRSDLAGASLLNREVSYVHCYFIGLTCLFWGLLPLAAGPALLEPHPVTRLVLLGAVAFWASRLVIQFVVFNHHGRESVPWFALSAAGTAVWLYLAGVWTWALAVQL